MHHRPVIAVSIALCLLAAASSRSLSAQGSAPRGTDSKVFDRWERKITTDALTDRKTDQLFFHYHAESNGRRGEFRVMVSCDDQIPSLEIYYLPYFQKEISFQSIVSTGLFNTVVQHTYVRTNTDGKIGMLELGTVQFGNQVDIALVPARAYLIAARDSRFEFTLANGDTPILRFNPQDKVFKDFVSSRSCSPPPPPQAVIVRPPAPAPIQNPANLLVAKPATSDFTFAGRMFLFTDDLRTVLRKRGIEVPNGEDPVQFVRTACKADQQEYANYDKYFSREARGLRTVTALRTTAFVGIEAGTYHMIVLARDVHGNYFADQVVTLEAGQNTVPFPPIQ